MLPEFPSPATNIYPRMRAARAAVFAVEAIAAGLLQEVALAQLFAGMISAGLVFVLPLHNDVHQHNPWSAARSGRNSRKYIPRTLHRQYRIYSQV